MFGNLLAAAAAAQRGGQTSPYGPYTIVYRADMHSEYATGDYQGTPYISFTGVSRSPIQTGVFIAPPFGSFQNVDSDRPDIANTLTVYRQANSNPPEVGASYAAQVGMTTSNYWDRQLLVGILFINQDGWSEAEGGMIIPIYTATALDENAPGNLLIGFSAHEFVIPDTPWSQFGPSIVPVSIGLLTTPFPLG